MLKGLPGINYRWAFNTSYHKITKSPAAPIVSPNVPADPIVYEGER